MNSSNSHTVVTTKSYGKRLMEALGGVVVGILLFFGSFVVLFNNLKEEYIDKGLVRFEHHAFPLDLAALNAEIIIRCLQDINKKFQLLGEIYKKQNQWAVGSDINVINESIKKIGLDFGLSNTKMDSCLKNESVQDQILNQRIEAQKKYEIQSTPTIFINEKKYKGEHKYKPFKKTIEKLL